MTRQIDFPTTLIVGGALLGGTLGWYFGHLFGFLLGAHVAIAVGFALEPTRRRLGLALGAAFLMWWPFWLGQWFWD